MRLRPELAPQPGLAHVRLPPPRQRIQPQHRRLVVLPPPPVPQQLRIRSCRAGTSLAASHNPCGRVIFSRWRPGWAASHVCSSRIDPIHQPDPRPALHQPPFFRRDDVAGDLRLQPIPEISRSHRRPRLQPREPTANPRERCKPASAADGTAPPGCRPH